MKHASIVLITLAAVSLAGCETTSSRPYQVSTPNVLAIQAAIGGDQSKVKIGSFSAADGVKTDLTCRAMGALEVAPGQSAIVYIREALQSELFQAGVYDQAGGQTIEATLDQLNFNSFGTGSWKVALRLRSSTLPEGYSVAVNYSFKTSYSALKACQNVIDAFQPTVSTLIQKAVNDPNFKKLAGEKAIAEVPAS